MTIKKQIDGDYRQPGEPAEVLRHVGHINKRAQRELIRREIQRAREERIRNLNRLAQWHEKRYRIAANQPDNRDNLTLWIR